MTKEEIIEFNKRCVLFLGYTFYSKWLELGRCEEDFNKVELPNFIAIFGEELQAPQLKFHSDWNWIMEVYLKVNRFIQIKSIENFIISTETNELHLAMWQAFEDTDNNKEKLVHAINQFLIWYEQNEKI